MLPSYIYLCVVPSGEELRSENGQHSDWQGAALVHVDDQRARATVDVLVARANLLIVVLPVIVRQAEYDPPRMCSSLAGSLLHQIVIVFEVPLRVRAEHLAVVTPASESHYLAAEAVEES